MIELTQGQHWTLTIIVGVLGLFLGQFVPKWKDRKDHDQDNLKNTEGLIAKHESNFAAYTECIEKCLAANPVTVELFTNLATAGTRYFDHINVIAGVIMSGQVNPQIRDGSLLPKIRAVANKTLQFHYETLAKIAAKNGFVWNGRLRKADYQSIFDVAEKFGLEGDPDV